MLYKFVVFLHVISVLGFLLAHGASATISYALKRERDVWKIRAMLDLSSASYPMMLWTLLATFVFGLIAAFLMPIWWRFGWIWVSIGFIGCCRCIDGSLWARGFSARSEKPLGFHMQSRESPSLPNPQRAMMCSAVLAKIYYETFRMVIGYGGFAVIAWLMRAKPF